MGKKWDKALPDKEAFKQMYRVLKPGALAFVMSSPRQDVLWRMMQMLEEVGFQLRQSFISWIYKTGFPKAMDVSKSIDKKYGAKRKKKRLKDVKRNVGNFKGRKDTRPYIEKAKKLGYHEFDGDIPITDLAKKWNGWKSITGLKPALECILMVNKPMSEKTIVDNVLKHGTGVMNVDACRIPFKNRKDIGDSERFRKYDNENMNIKTGWNQNSMKSSLGNPVGNKGRFPANLLVSDKAIDSGKITKSNIDRRDEESSTGKSGIYHEGWKRKPNMCNDSGDQSRYFSLDQWWNNRCIFFDVPKPSKSERNKGLENMPKQSTKQFNKGMEGKVRSDGTVIKEAIQQSNFHPCVKPIKLMCYLIELGCSKEGIVLDPFVGSGTTCIAAKMLNRKFIGIELNEEYAKIASARLENVEIVKYDSSKKLKVKPIKKFTKSKGLKPKCGFKDKCNFKVNGECTMKRHCKDKVI